MNGDDRQAYDRGTSLYSPDGRIYQVEYAREAVSRGAPAVGIRTDAGVVLAAVVKARSSLQVEESVEKLHRLDDHIGTATAGHAADARRLVDAARQAAQVERVRYGEAIDPETLVTGVADEIQEYTQSGGTRPFGAALLVGGYLDGEASLFALGPEGVPETWRAAVVGAGSEPVRERLEAEYDEALSVDDAIALAATALREHDEELAAADLAVAVVDADGYRHLDADELAALVPAPEASDDESDDA